MGITWHLLARRVLVPGCRVVMDMDKDMASEEVLVAGRAPHPRLVRQRTPLKKSREGVEERWQVLGLNLQLVPILIYTSSRVVACYVLLSS